MSQTISQMQASALRVTKIQLNALEFICQRAKLMGTMLDEQQHLYELKLGYANLDTT